ncbi:MAG: Ig-like domain-containing protein [Planctomycetota bacterium]
MLAASTWAASADVAVTVRLVPPVSVTMTEARTADSNGDGYVDQLTFQFSAPVDIVDPGGGGDGLPCLTLSGGYVIAASDYTATGVNSLTLNLIPLAGAPDTNALITATFVAAGGSLISMAGGGFPMIDGTVAPAVDGARPVVVQLLPTIPAVVTSANITLVATFSEPVSNLSNAGVAVSNAVVTSITRTAADAFAVVITPQVQGTFSVQLSNGAVTDPAANLSRATPTLTRQWILPPIVNGFTITGATISGTATGSSIVVIDGVQHITLNNNWSGFATLPGADPKLINVPVLLFGRWGYGQMITIDIAIPPSGGGG